MPFPPLDLPVRHAERVSFHLHYNNLVDILGQGQTQVKVVTIFKPGKSLIDAANSVPGSTFLHTAWKLDCGRYENHPNLPDACKILEDAAAIGSTNVYALLNYDLGFNSDARNSSIN